MIRIINERNMISEINISQKLLLDIADKYDLLDSNSTRYYTNDIYDEYISLKLSKPSNFDADKLSSDLRLNGYDEISEFNYLKNHMINFDFNPKSQYIIISLSYKYFNIRFDKLSNEVSRIM